MNFSSRIHPIVLRCAALILAVFAALFALFASVASAAPHRNGQALVLRASLAGAGARSAWERSLLAHPPAWQVGPNGRALLSPVSLQSRANASPRITRDVAHAGGAPIIISEPVRTYDVFAPPPGFQTQLPTGPLTPTNLTPVWSADETFLVFSSNRGGDGHFHIYAVAASGGAVTQITSGPGNEFFPVLNSSNSALAFTSDANSPGNQQLYLIGGQSGVSFRPNNPPVDVSTLNNPNNEKTSPNNDFASVGRPAFSPGDDRLAFSALAQPTSTHTPNAHHIYFVYTATNGFQPQPSPGLANPPAALTDGSGDDTNPAWSPDGRYIAFDSTAANVDNSGQQISPTTAPSTTSGGAAGGARSIFLISGGVNTAFGTVPPPLQGAHGRVTVAGTDDFAPAWSFNTSNQFFNPNGILLYLAFARAGARGQNHDIYYFRLTNSNAASMSPQGADAITPETTGGSNPAVHQNTDDNPGAGGPNDPGNNYDDTYPAWSPFINIFSVTYQSPRSVTYDQPGSNTPLETAQSLSQGSSIVGPSYTGLLISQVLNLDPPTLLRYSGSQVIRVTDQRGNDTRNIQPSVPGSPSSVTFTVRLSDREAGTDDSKVFLQIKDPDSKYQDSQGLEHKVFSGDPGNYNATQKPVLTPDPFNPSNPPILTVKTSGSEGLLFDGGDFLGFNIVGGNKLFTIGAVGGVDNTDTITVGHDVDGTTKSYQSWGPEYECDYVNPQVANPGTATGDYGVPYYLAGFDDQTAFGGFGPSFSNPPRPTTNTTNPTTMQPITAEWLPMTRLTDAQQDGQGGVLYSATYQTPQAPSDFYLDVIAYDRAAFPNIAAFPAAPANPTLDYHGQSQNFRIYDNVGGFTTAVFDGGNDILVVSDNALGQKFAATTFGQSRNANLLPTFYGAESYYTDVDENVLPTAIDHYVTANGMPTLTVQKLSTPNQFLGAFFSYPDVQNGLGVGSYNDTLTDDGGRVNEPNANLPSLIFDPNTKKFVPNPNVPFVKSQKYSLWRILSRGPIPQSVLGAYQPTFQSQPPVTDTINNVKADAAPNVPVANRCVIWVSPYTGELPLIDAGSLENATTQDSLTAFVNGGGRLCITGQNVAGAFTIQGQKTSAFLNNVLGADFATSSGGSQTLTGASKRISGDSGGGNYYAFLSGGGNLISVLPSATPLFLGNDFNAPPNWRADGSLDQLGPVILELLSFSRATESFVARINTVRPFNGSGATPDINTNGVPGLLYHENTTAPLGQGFGSRTVFASFGLEGIGIEYQKVVVKSVPFFVPHNTRPNILHNIVNYLRTGVFSGRITLASGQGVAGATVYLSSIATIPGPRQVFSGITDFGGNYTISGVEPGTYNVTTYKSGFTTTTSNINYSVEGDTSQVVGLVVSPIPPGRINGTVTDQSTGKGLGGASVTFTSVDGQVVLGPVVTNPDGTYSIDNAPVAAYNGTASKLPQYASNTPVQGNPITVPSGGTAQADFKLVPAPATVKGIVFNDKNGNGTQDNGEPGISGATMQLKPTTQGTPTPAAVTTGSDGSYTVTNLAPGTYTIAVSASGFAPSTSQTVTVAAADNVTRNIPLTAIPPVQNGTLGGLVTDGATNQAVGGITITYTSTTPGATNGTVVTNGSTTNAPDGSGPINYSTGLQPGQYTVSVSASGGFGALASKTVTVTSNTFSRADFTFPVVHTFQKGKNFFSVPYDYASAGVSFDTLLGGAGNRSHVFVYQPQQLQYVLDPTPPADGLHLGIGSWVNLNNAASVSRTGPPAGAATVAVALHLGWNMIGVPNQNPVPVSTLLFANRTGGGSLTFSQAVSPTYQLISPTLYSYNGTGTTTANAYNAVGSKDSLQPWMGYWIYAYADTTVLIPAG